MPLIFNTTFYHGTDRKNIPSIIKNGFEQDSISCACRSFKFASGYGNAVLEFKYPCTVKLKYLLWFIWNVLIKRDSIICVSGFKIRKELRVYLIGGK